MDLNKKLLIKLSLVFLAIFVLSYLAGQVVILNNVLWLAVILIAAVLTIYKLEYGVYLAIAELLTNSFGYLFFFQYNNLKISLRVGLFAVIMAVWGIRLVVELIRKKKLVNYLQVRKSKLAIGYGLLAIVLVWGMVWGYLRGNSLSNLIFDSNNWFYFLYILPFYDAIKKEALRNIFSIFCASIIANFILTFVTFVIFSQDWEFAKPLYHWLRDFRFAEITHVSGSLWRMFMPEQIYAAIGVVVFFWFWMFGKKNQILDIGYWILLFILSTFTVILSMSRSFWIGDIAAFAILFVLLFFKYQFRLQELFKWAGKLILIIALEVGLIVIIVGLGSGGLLANRITDLTGEAGMSRINQLQPLAFGIIKHPVIGSGFGTTVTYQTQDPTIIKLYAPDGWYTTYAFEWGYLDILLKIGLFGLGVYLILIYKIVRQLPIGYELWAIGLAVILVSNIFSPYLNHPLGIGYIILLSCLLNTSLTEEGNGNKVN